MINARYRTMLTVTNAKGEVLINEIVPARSEHRFQNGAPFEVRLGYASGSTATFGGEPIDMNARVKMQNGDLYRWGFCAAVKFAPIRQPEKLLRCCWRGMRFQAAFAEKAVHPRIHRQPENPK